ncbi:MAG: PD40 domain-containing protein [Candidatus Kapabacteria bacterium]|nr:PD40 domain-containing protein [Candidatus Kapabacteria bacterium]
MRVIFLVIFFITIITATVYAQSYSVGGVTPVQLINTANDDFAPRVINNELHWIENLGTVLKKKSKPFPLEVSNETIVSQGVFVDVYASSSIIARPIQTEEYLTVQLFQHSQNNDETLPLFEEFSYCSQPSISPSGNVLYFSGRNDENTFTTDIFVSFKLNGKWQSPIVLSSKINSEANEITPFAISEDTLIFASNGLGGKGGYDLFIVSKDGSQWNDPISLNELNSSGNDSDPFVTKEGVIYFASDRKGIISGYDIYSASFIPQTIETKEAITYYPKGIEILRSSTEELFTIPTIIPLPWLESIPSSTSSEFPLYDEWKKTIGLIEFQREKQHSVLSAFIPSTVSITPTIVTQIRELLKNFTPIIRQNSGKVENGIVLITDNIQQFKPLKISNTTQKLLTPQLTFFWERKDFDATQWEVNVATSSVNLLSLFGKCLPDEQSLQFSLDTIVKLLSTEDDALNCTVYLINEQSEVFENTFSIPIIKTTISKTGKTSNVWNNFYVYFGDVDSKKAVYSLYTQSILDASIANELQIEYSKEYENDALLFQQLLETNGKKVTTKVRKSRYVQESGAAILESTMMTISFPR